MGNEFADLSQFQISSEDMAAVIKAKQTKRQRRKTPGRYAVVPTMWIDRMLGCRSAGAWQLMIMIALFTRMRKGTFQLTNETANLNRKAKSRALHIVERRLNGCISVKHRRGGKAPAVNISKTVQEE
jgi:hypothetical protein